jgi:hypothetical protein
MFPLLRGAANDNRWRMREATAMALQKIGEADPTERHTDRADRRTVDR